jgi:protein-disulfide isomerase
MDKILPAALAAKHFMESNLSESVKRFAPFIVVAAVAILTVSSGVFLYRAKRPAGSANPVINQVETTSDSHELGSHSAKVTLEEFGDFQCPPCGMLSEPLNGLVR